MDIDLLSKMVKELIMDNDKVVLPGLGAFVAETVPSTFTDKGYTINPPYRRLSFRAKSEDDSALASFYASSNDVDFDVADRVVRDFIAELKTILYIRKTVAFPGLGRMRATKENTVFFVADEDLDIYPDGIGLEPVSLKTHLETKEEVEAAVAGLKAIVDESMPEIVVPVDVVEEVPDEENVVEEVPDVEDVMEATGGEAQVEVHLADTEEEEAHVASMPVRKRGWGLALDVVLWSILVAGILLAIFVVVSRLFPNVFDHILYTKEELEILYSQL